VHAKRGTFHRRNTNQLSMSRFLQQHASQSMPNQPMLRARTFAPTFSTPRALAVDVWATSSTLGSAAQRHRSPSHLPRPTACRAQYSIGRCACDRGSHEMLIQFDICQRSSPACVCFAVRLWHKLVVYSGSCRADAASTLTISEGIDQSTRLARIRSRVPTCATHSALG
jgi:hypothetical protein